MIARNEERWIDRCLRSVRGVVDEVIVVDTGSEDATAAIAASHGALVLRHPWEDDFARARNVGLEHATGDWVLVLDADEELEPRTRAALRPTIARTAAEGLQVRQRSFLPPGEIQKYDDLFITRLFRNRPEHRYERPIHEQILRAIERHGGAVRESDLTILHHGYARPTAQGEELRAARNLKLLEKALAASPEDPYLHFQLGATHKALGNQGAAHASLCRALELDYEALGPATVARLYMKLAQLALASDRWGEATEYAGQSLARDPDNPVSLHVVALAHLFQGDVAAAYPAFLRLRRCPTANPAGLGDLDAVLRHCRRTLTGRRPP